MLDIMFKISTRRSAFGVPILFGLTWVLFLCSGKVYPPSNKTKFVFSNGSTARLQWNVVDATDIVSRIWSFKSSDGSPEERIATIIFNNPPEVANSSLPRVSVKPPATLILHNVTEIYDGTYKFNLGATGGGISEVVVYIAVQPNVSINCSSHVFINKGDEIICECKCENGNPPAKCTWYKNGTQDGEIKARVNTLILPDVNKEDSGNYTCVGKSHVEAQDEKSIKVVVYFKPVNTAILFSQKSVEIGESVTITCASEGFPEPRFTIFHNDTKVVSNERTYNICQVKWDDAGTYKCFTYNMFGNDAAFANLTIKEPISTTLSIKPTTIRTLSGGNTTSNAAEKNTLEDSCNCGISAEWYIIVVTLASGIIIGILLSHIVSYSRRKWFTRPEQTPEIKITDSTYQELDLTKMNRQENYQSLGGNAARNDGVDDDSTYTQLNSKKRDVENNYQSLT